MGGYKGGEIASKLALEAFQEHFKVSSDISKSLQTSLEQANSAIKEYKEKNLEVSNMGTTLIALYITEDSFQWISVGDSPLYIIRDSKIKRINANHSVAGLLELQVKAKEITEEEADTNTNKHLLTSVVNGEDISMVDISKKILFKSGDILILASDGIETLNEKELLKIVLNREDIQGVSGDIIKAIELKNKTNQDNSTFICIKKDNINTSPTKKRSKIIENIIIFVAVIALGMFGWIAYVLIKIFS